MKLETIVINGIEYYQWIILGTRENDFMNTVGDIFRDWRIIPFEKEKLKQTIDR